MISRIKKKRGARTLSERGQRITNIFTLPWTNNTSNKTEQGAQKEEIDNLKEKLQTLTEKFSQMERQLNLGGYITSGGRPVPGDPTVYFNSGMNTNSNIGNFLGYQTFQENQVDKLKNILGPFKIYIIFFSEKASFWEGTPNILGPNAPYQAREQYDPNQHTITINAWNDDLPDPLGLYTSNANNTQLGPGGEVPPHSPNNDFGVMEEADGAPAVPGAAPGAVGCAEQFSASPNEYGMPESLTVLPHEYFHVWQHGHHAIDFPLFKDGLTGFHWIIEGSAKLFEWLWTTQEEFWDVSFNNIGQGYQWNFATNETYTSGSFPDVNGEVQNLFRYFYATRIWDQKDKRGNQKDGLRPYWLDGVVERKNGGTPLYATELTMVIFLCSYDYTKDYGGPIGDPECTAAAVSMMTKEKFQNFINYMKSIPTDCGDSLARCGAEFRKHFKIYFGLRPSDFYRKMGQYWSYHGGNLGWATNQERPPGESGLAAFCNLIPPSKPNPGWINLSEIDFTTLIEDGTPRDPPLDEIYFPPP